MLAQAPKGNTHLQQLRIVTGIRSGFLGRLDCSAMELIVRTAFTSFGVWTILERATIPSKYLSI